MTAMKNVVRFFILIAFAAVFSSCQKEQETKEEPVAEGVEINIVANGSPETKTAVVDGAVPSVKWLSTDQLTVYEIVDGDVNQTTTTTSTTLTEGDYVANFKATIPGADPLGSSYKYAAVYPAAAVSEGSGFYRLTLPNAQTLIGNNFSADSDLMISEVLDHGNSRVTSSENISFQFKRIGTAVKLTLKGITADEKIQKVIITAPHYIAGRVKYVRETSSLVSDSWHYSGQGQNDITLTVPDVTATGTDVLWFRVLAAEKWASGEELSIEVETDKANYYRNGYDGSHAVITLGKDIEFVDGGLTAFGVNLSSYRVAKPVATRYTKVTSAAQISSGGEYLVVATKKGSTDICTMGTFNASNYFNATDVTEGDDSGTKYIDITSETVNTLTFVDAGSDKYYLVDSDDMYLYWSSGNNVYHNSTNAETNAYKWTVTTTAITNVGTTSRVLKYNADSPRFACYTSATNITLYVKDGSLLPLGISFDDASYEFVVGSGEYLAFTGQAVTKAGGGSDDRAVTYSVVSDDDDIISSINASSGAIVLSGNTGIATIKATVDAKDGVYKAGYVTYTITVMPEPITFVKTTSIVSGSKYLIVANYEGTYYMATPILDGGKTYGYPTVQEVTPQIDGSILVYNYDNAYTISTSGVGYSIKQSDNRYWYASGDHTSISIGATPTSVWTAEKQVDNTFRLTSETYWIQYSDDYDSYGRYTTQQDHSALPYLYIEDDGSPRLGGTNVEFTNAIADIESSTLSVANLTGVSYKCTAKPDWIEEVEFEGNTMNVVSKDNKTLSPRNGVITVKATGTEGNVSANINVSQVASVFSATSTAAMNFAWDDETNSTVKSTTITSTYVLTEGANMNITGTNSAKFDASLKRVGETDEYTLEVWVAEDNDGDTDYEAAVTVSRDGLDIPISLKQAHKVNITKGATWSSVSPLKKTTTGISGGNQDQSYGIQIYGDNTCTFTKSDYSGGIETVKVHASTTSKGVGTITVTVGGTALEYNGEDTLTLSKLGNTDVEYTFEAPDGLLTGTLVVTVSASVNSLYFKQVIIN